MTTKKDTPSTAAADPANTNEAVTLSSGIRRGETLISTVVLRQPTAGELRGTNLLDVMQMNVDAMLKLIPRISTPTLHEPELARLDPADFTALAAKVIGFFVPKDTPTEYH